jgi:alkylation response protein AidB-like acyl-CoA dehydrogenase
MPLFPSGTELSEDHRLLIDTAGEFAQAELLPLDRKWDTDESSVAEVLPTLAEMGLLNICIPEELNGLGCPFRIYTAILHEIAVWSPSTAVTISVHSMVGHILKKRAKEPRRSEWVSGWGDAANFAAFALSEAGAGSDAGAATTAAVRVDGGFRVTGEKMWITNGMTSRWFLTLVRLQDVPEDESLCAVVIDGNDPGVERTKIAGKMGIRGSETAVTALTDVFVPEDYLIGERGKGLRVCLTTLNEGRIGIAAQATGIAEACLNEMVSYAREREQFGRPIGKFQAVGDMIAESAVELEAAKSLTWRAAHRVDAGTCNPAISSMAKLYATEAANRIAYRAVQVHGGAGYVNECRVEQLYRDARVTTIYEGTSEVQRILIARELASQGA